MKAFAWIESTIGKTPVVTLKTDSGLTVAKLERANLTGSVKDRIVLEAVKDAIKAGYKAMVEATTGNTGISLAAIGSALGLDVTVIMPKSMTNERRKLIKHYGASLVLVKDMKEGRELAMELARENDWYFLDQFNNPNALMAGRKLGKEIVDWLLKSKIQPTNVVAAVGTGATLAGIGAEVKAKFPSVEVYGIKSVGQIDGTRDGVDTPFLETVKIDGWIKVRREEAVSKARELARLGLGVGISSGANVVAAERLGGVTVTVFPDSAERYFSTEVFSDEKLNEQTFLCENVIQLKWRSKR